MFLFQTILSRIKGLRFINENKGMLLIFFGFSFLFSLYMVFVEKFSLLDTYYFLVTTATTVGYGDYSPKTGFGKILVTLYMLVGIALIGVFLGKITDIMVEMSSRRKKGHIRMKNAVDLIIAGYPSSDKVHSIVRELRNDSHFTKKIIVCVTHLVAEKPLWMSEQNVHFIQGSPSKVSTLQAAGIESAKTVLILTNNPSLVESDEHSIAVCAIAERLNSQVHTIIEKVRKDALLFQIVQSDTIVDVASPSVLAQEILAPGAIDLQNVIFSTQTAGTQYNIRYHGNNTVWSDMAALMIKHNTIPEGFQNPNEKQFNLLPHQGDEVLTQAWIKYRAIQRLETINF